MERITRSRSVSVWRASTAIASYSRKPEPENFTSPVDICLTRSVISSARVLIEAAAEPISPNVVFVPGEPRKPDALAISASILPAEASSLEAMSAASFSVLSMLPRLADSV